ncbi:MAG: hypothetical protein ACO3QB_15425, partial [bacterium]
WSVGTWHTWKPLMSLISIWAANSQKLFQLQISIKPKLQIWTSRFGRELHPLGVTLPMAKIAGLIEITKF